LGDNDIKCSPSKTANDTLGGFEMAGWFPENVSTFGGDVDGVFWLIFYITAVWFFITEGLILYFVFRYRRKAGHRAVYATGDRREHGGFFPLKYLFSAA
jgi:heme/copper-type cytochrome/quinol oxidase subunit 2